MKVSGLTEVLPSLDYAVWVVLSAGEFVRSKSPAGYGSALGIVNFSIFSHLSNPDLPENILTNAEKWAADIASPAYAIHDETAIEVVDGAAEIVSEGQWKQVTRSER